MKHILLPTDFSDDALNAILIAIKLQCESPCSFIILHTYEPAIRNSANRKNGNRTGLVNDALREDALNKLEETLQAIAKVSEYPQHTFLVKAIQGDLTSVINEFISEHDLDLIVMGTKGATAAKQIFLGSNTVRVIKKIRNCAILAVPKKFNFKSLRKIVFPTEYAHFFSKRQLSTLVGLAEVWRSQVLVFHVAQEFRLSEQQMANKKILKQRLGPVNHSFYKVAIHTTISEAINEFAEEQSADLICLVKYQHTLIEKMTQESVVKKLGFTSKIPLLVLPE